MYWITLIIFTGIFLVWNRISVHRRSRNYTDNSPWSGVLTNGLVHLSIIPLVWRCNVVVRVFLFSRCYTICGRVPFQNCDLDQCVTNRKLRRHTQSFTHLLKLYITTTSDLWPAFISGNRIAKVMEILSNGLPCFYIVSLMLLLVSEDHHWQRIRYTSCTNLWRLLWIYPCRSFRASFLTHLGVRHGPPPVLQVPFFKEIINCLPSGSWMTGFRSPS